MNRRFISFAALLLAGASHAQRQMYERVVVDQRGDSRTMKPLVMGTHYAATSMMPQATLAAQRMLEAGGNAFDAIVTGQAVLGLVQPASNGIGGDAVLLVYDARAKKVWSINAEGTAPKLATIDWYRTHSNNKIPLDETLLAATIPGVVDAWYILLSRWGTKSFAQVLAPAIELAERGVPLTSSQARGLNSSNLAKYPTTKRLYQPEGKRWSEGDLFRNQQLARTFRRLIEAETQGAAQGRAAALKAARDRFYKGDIAREMATFAQENGGLMRYEDFASYSGGGTRLVRLSWLCRT